jgi:hypothetical protein
MLSQGQTVDLVGRSVDSSWFVIRVGDGYGWVFVGFVQVSGDISTLAVVEAPPQ